MAELAVLGKGIDQALIIHSQLCMFPDKRSPVIALAPVARPVQAMP